MARFLDVRSVYVLANVPCDEYSTPLFFVFQDLQLAINKAGKKELDEQTNQPIWYRLVEEPEQASQLSFDDALVLMNGANALEIFELMQPVEVE